MYSLSVRINQISFFYFCCLAALGAFNIATTIINKEKPIVKNFEFNTKYVYVNPFSKVQHCTGSLTFDIDFRKCLNWNSNLLFSWITATYETGKNLTTSVTIWDRIMLRDDINSQMANENNLTTFYPLVDANKKLNGKDVLLELHWEHMPVVGPIIKKKLTLGTIKIKRDGDNKPDRKLMAREYDYEDETGRDYYE